MHKAGAIQVPSTCDYDRVHTPLHHQQATQTRVVKGLGCDRHGSLPSFLPSEAQIFCCRRRWGDLRESDSGDTIINQAQAYRKDPCRETIEVVRDALTPSTCGLRNVRGKCVRCQPAEAASGCQSI